MTFDARIGHEYCCDNYMYNRKKTEQVPVFEIYNVTARLGIIYVGIAEYSNLLLSSERKRLLAKIPTKGPKTAPNQICAYKEALKNITL